MADRYVTILNELFVQPVASPDSSADHPTDSSALVRHSPTRLAPGMKTHKSCPTASEQATLGFCLASVHRRYRHSRGASAPQRLALFIHRPQGLRRVRRVKLVRLGVEPEIEGPGHHLLHRRTGITECLLIQYEQVVI